MMQPQGDAHRAPTQSVDIRPHRDTKQGACALPWRTPRTGPDSKPAQSVSEKAEVLNPQ